MVVVDFNPKEITGKGIAAMILTSLELDMSPRAVALPPYTIEYLQE